ncbi:MAG: B12-binding domain-containing radical SAM protein [Elusimicrobia bacterium]|nr:B12-binding domain-containing radical SAM protein [Candidatus Obscuribacterium magneticum]
MQSLDDIVLIQLDFGDPDSAFFPLAAITLASFLKSADFSASVFDFNIQRLHASRSSQDARSLIPFSKLNIYGITVYYGMILQALRVARYLKKRDPKCCVILGGPGLFSFEHDIIRRFSPLTDIIVIQEGVESLVDILGSIRKDGRLPKSVRGTVRWDSDKQCIDEGEPRPLLANLDDWPLPDYTLIDVPIYLQHQEIKEVPILVGTGCPFSCSFCSTCNFWRHTYRAKSPHRILREMELLHRSYGVSAFSLIHDNIFPSSSVMDRFNKALRDDRRFTWSASLRLDVVEQQTPRRLSEAGCRGLTIGIETASIGQQKKIGKSLDLSGLDATVEAFGKYGIELHLGFMLDLPQSTREDNEETVSLAFRLMSRYDRVFAKVRILYFLNGSQVFNLRKQFVRNISKDIGELIAECAKYVPRTIWRMSQEAAISPLRLMEIIYSKSKGHPLKRTPSDLALAINQVTLDMVEPNQIRAEELDANPAGDADRPPLEPGFSPVSSLFDPIDCVDYKILRLERGYNKNQPTADFSMSFFLFAVWPDLTPVLSRVSEAVAVTLEVVADTPGRSLLHTLISLPFRPGFINLVRTDSGYKNTVSSLWVSKRLFYRRNACLNMS